MSGTRLAPLYEPLKKTASLTHKQERGTEISSTYGHQANKPSQVKQNGEAGREENEVGGE